jgi:hypothetical protein
VKEIEDGVILWLGSRGIEGSGGGALDGFNAEEGKMKREGESARCMGMEEKMGGGLVEHGAQGGQRFGASGAAQKLSRGRGSQPRREAEGCVGHVGGLGLAVGRRKRPEPKETIQFLIYSKNFKRLKLI